MKGLHVSEQEARRGQILNLMLGKRCGANEVAALLNLSERHVWRLLAKYRAEGIGGLVHGNRGQSPANATPEAIRRQIEALARGPYDGANDTHLTELLGERDGIALSRPTVRRIRRAAGLRSPRRRRAPQHRSRRERYSQEGMLLQLDGSEHRWLGPDGPMLTLIAAIDDATGTIPYGLFREQEDAHGYFLLLQGVISRKGVPLALYSDRHSIFTVSQPQTLAQQLAGKPATTQFGRAMETLNVELVLANSPQAKGRIERLWGTLQDRLVLLLRLAEAKTIDQANQVLWAFLDQYNSQFGVPAKEPDTAYRLVPQEIDLDAVLCFAYSRIVAADNTVSFDGRELQIAADAHRSSYARTQVEVQERLDGRLVVAYQGRELASTDAPLRPVILRARKLPRATKHPNSLPEGGTVDVGQANYPRPQPSLEKGSLPNKTKALT